MNLAITLVIQGVVFFLVALRDFRRA